MHAHTYTHTHTHTRARAHTHTHRMQCSLSSILLPIHPAILTCTADHCLWHLQENEQQPWPSRYIWRTSTSCRMRFRFWCRCIITVGTRDIEAACDSQVLRFIVNITKDFNNVAVQGSELSKLPPVRKERLKS